MSGLPGLPKAKKDTEMNREDNEEIEMNREDKEYLKYRVTRKSSAVLGRVINKLIAECKADKSGAVIALWRAADQVLATTTPEREIELRKSAILEFREAILLAEADIEGVPMLEMGNLMETAEAIEGAAEREAEKFYFHKGRSPE